MKTQIALVALLTAAAAPALAQQAADRAGHPPMVAAATGSAELADGEVRKVDKETKKLTIRHGPIPNLDMPPMTMVFQVQDAAILDAVKAGDKIRFRAEKPANGGYTVTRVEPAK